MTTLILNLQSLCWNPLTLLAFTGTGFYFSLKTRFFQFRHPVLIFRSTFGSLRKSGKSDGISPIAALSSALAACMGTGNIIGVAAALNAGGAGAVFWMVISALLGEMTCCAENVLSIEHRTKNDKNEWSGGSMAYIEKAFSSRRVACVFAVLCIGASLGMGNMTQSNAIAGVICHSGNIAPLSVGIVTATISGLIIIGGIRRIASFTEKLIPAVSLIFIAALITTIIVNCDNILPCLKEIITCAFGIKPVIGGAAGYSVSKAVKTGVARGVFSNEAGLGSSAIVHAASSEKSSAVQGMWGIVEVFIDTVLMCTLTALALMTSGAYTGENNLSEIEMNTAAFSEIFGRYSGGFVGVSLCIFAFATVIGWEYYGEKATEYAFGRKGVGFYRGIYLCCIAVGAAARLETVWALSDIFNALMAVPNLAALIILRKKAVQPLRAVLPLGIKR
ncbi:MAG: sodium:alanine symporter family protein [Clostridia bacterium]|nr:sodium:alanine symporter family protein [Clostridia bacterium]